MEGQRVWKNCAFLICFQACVCVRMHKTHSGFYRPAKRHRSETAHDAAVERTRHPAQEKIITVALTIFYRFHLYWLTCIFFLPWPRTPGLWNYWNVCTILKHLFKSCFSLKGRYYSQIQSQIKKPKQILSLQALRIGMHQRTYQLPFPFGMLTAAQRLRQSAGVRVYNPFKFTGQTGKEGKCQKLQIKQLIFKSNEACKWIIFRHAVSDFLNICHSFELPSAVFVNLRTCLKYSHG